MKQKEWFKLKFYPHIGLPLTNDEKEKVCSYIKDKNCIKRHSFMPFIHKTITTRKFRKEYSKDGCVLNDKKRVVGSPKVRDIYYSSHLDANIFSYYGFLINKKYDTILKNEKLESVVTAYRQIPVIENGKIIRNKCNIDFANEVFDFIKSKSNEEVVAITFDIKGFFDNLNHSKLKKSWCDIFGWIKLEDDHYNVFKNITKFSFVEEQKLFDLFKDNIIIRTESTIIKRVSIDKIKHLMNSKAIAFCEKKDIDLIRKKGLIHSNKRIKGKLRDFGICQGSPISSVLANIYLLDFDKKIKTEIDTVKGLYRRYSDDMILVCPKTEKDYFINLVKDSIDKIAKLEIQSSKTQIFHFYKKLDNIVCAQEFEGVLNENSEKRNLEYLGFSFNGEIVSLKTSSLAKYYRKMKLNVRRCKYYSKVIDNKTKGEIFKRRLYKKFSYIGSFRTRKYKRKFGTTDQWIRTHKYNWGNYITYAKLAIKTIKNSNIKSQIRKHWKNLNLEMK